MHETDPVIAMAILLGAALVGGMVAHRLKQPVILGYLVVGVIVGPYALGLVADVTLVEAAATIGVALMMFTLGLEISIAQLKEVGRVGLWGGITQILLTAVLGYTIGIVLFQWPLLQAVLFGLLISLSSTMVCFKILMERGELDSVHGRIMVAILVLQDISVVLMAVVEPLLGGSAENLVLTLVLALGKAILFVGISTAAGLWVLPYLLGRVGGVRSRELFLLTVMVLSLGAALATYIYGLSVIFGAFVIGLALRESKFGHQALAEITPLRDIFATLFFVSLGMLLDPRFLFDNWALIAVTVTLIVVTKFLVVFGIVNFFGYRGSVAWLTGAGLFQIGEFSFILAQAGMSTGIISAQFYSLVLASAIVTMILTPVSMSLVSRVDIRLGRISPGRDLMAEEIAALTSESDRETKLVVIAGYGRIGGNIAQGLRDAGIPHAVIEIDPEVVSRCRNINISCTYGDASNASVLSRMSVSEVEILVVTFPDPLAVVTTVKNALAINPKLKIVARVHRAREARLLESLGVTQMVNPEYEASVELLKKILSLVGLRKAERDQVLTVIRQDDEITEFSFEEEI